MSIEHERLAASNDDLAPWRLWGPYVSGRQWGTVREDYSAAGDAWDYLPFDDAHRRAYRWGEDGLAGLCDRFGFFNLSLALWNGADDRLKDRLFGLTNSQGNHGEDVKEVWWPTDATPTHSYASWLYRYPQQAFPYAELLHENAARGRDDAEYELTDTGILADDRFFDIEVTHAKATPTDIVVQVTATNHGPDEAPLDLILQGWFRNTWAWGRDSRKPSMQRTGDHVQFQHDWLGGYQLVAEGEPQILFCDNETDDFALYGTASASDCPKDGLDQTIVHGNTACTRSDQGTKVGFRWHFDAVGAGQSVTVRLRLTALPQEGPAATTEKAGRDLRATAGADHAPVAAASDDGSDTVLTARRAESDEFYAQVLAGAADDQERHIARRAFAGLLWGRQLYRYSVAEWLEGDPAQPEPPAQRRTGRNSRFSHLDIADIISMPDEWEYPWFASWDLAFHTLPLADVDPWFAKLQIELMVREWSQHPNGQLPAYEWDFGDVNPPVLAWAARMVHRVDGGSDTGFLVRVFSKLLLNFSWWVNRKDADGSYLFEGGFLGMDNIGFFDRSAPLSGGARLEQSDATSWMAFYALSMLQLAVELARNAPGWDDVARMFFEYFLRLAGAMDDFGSAGVSLWSPEDGFYYDTLVRADGSSEQLPVRSLVGLLPLIAVHSIHPIVLDQIGELVDEVEWMQRRDTALADALIHHESHEDDRVTIALVPSQRRTALYRRLFDEAEFLSPHGIRSLSAVYRDGFEADVDGSQMSIRYVPGESDSGLFGGNSNWRGPVWMPVNVLLLDALRSYAAAEPDLLVEHPTGSGVSLTLQQIADDLRARLIGLMRTDANGRRPGTPTWYSSGPLWDPHVTFSEYFHGDTGAGLGATHQTGWTALLAHLICHPGGLRD
ncbi:glucosidase [Dermatophilaceae bacterium Sec6.4]